MPHKPDYTEFCAVSDTTVSSTPLSSLPQMKPLKKNAAPCKSTGHVGESVVTSHLAFMEEWQEESGFLVKATRCPV